MDAMPMPIGTIIAIAVTRQIILIAFLLNIFISPYLLILLSILLIIAAACARVAVDFGAKVPSSMP